MRNSRAASTRRRLRPRLRRLPRGLHLEAGLLRQPRPRSESSPAKPGGHQPLFLYLHFLDPHGPYQPPQESPIRSASGRPEKKFIRNGDPEPDRRLALQGGARPGYHPGGPAHLVDLYDEEIAYFDAEFARLLARAARPGCSTTSIVVFAVRPRRGVPGARPRQALPATFRHHDPHAADGADPGRRAEQVAEPVQNLDIVPTLLDYLGIEPRSLPLEGRSLRPADRGAEAAGEESGTGPAEGRRQYGIQGTLRSVSDGRYKLIHDLALGAFALYDLRADPGETGQSSRTAAPSTACASPRPPGSPAPRARARRRRALSGSEAPLARVYRVAAPMRAGATPGACARKRRAVLDRWLQNLVECG